MAALSIQQQERDEFLQKEPAAAPYFRRWLGADEFLNGYERGVFGWVIVHPMC